MHFCKFTQKCFAYSAATKNLSDTVLYSKRTEVHPLSSHIKTVSVAFYELSNKTTKMLYFEDFDNFPKSWPFYRFWNTL